MRNLLKSLRSSVSSRQQAQAQLQPSLEEGSSSENDHHDDDNADTKEDPKKQQLQDEIGDSLHDNGQHSREDTGDSILDLQDVTRITKRDTKKERRMKYKHCFERNNVIMVSERFDRRQREGDIVACPPSSISDSS